jgi:hypothetical protein
MEYLALEDGSPSFPQSCMFRGTQVSLIGRVLVSGTGLSPSMAAFSTAFLYQNLSNGGIQDPLSDPTTPCTQRPALDT